MNNRFVQRYVRQYASSIGLNSNDEEHANVTSYSTRVERIRKAPEAKQWTLTLRKIAPEPAADGRLRVDWWTEEFDAVVVATVAENDAPWTPPIPGLDKWANAFPKEIYHGRNYRRPLEGKVRFRSTRSRCAVSDLDLERPHCGRFLVWRWYSSGFSTVCCFSDHERSGEYGILYPTSLCSICQLKVYASAQPNGRASCSRRRIVSDTRQCHSGAGDRKLLRALPT